MKRKAFITGINGQDGSYLAEYLISLGYEVHGIVRRNSVSENQQSRLGDETRDNLNIYYGDLLDQGCLERLLDDIQPDEIYNLAAQSHVRISFDVPQFTVQTNAIGVLNILEAYRRSCPTAKFYQASSSEMFGNSVDEDGFQRESTAMSPVSLMVVLKYLDIILLDIIETPINTRVMVYYLIMNHQDVHLIL
jgi:GDPmannose 4,6-dehydratase